MNFTADILCWFKHSDETLGACALAAAEYKPNSSAAKNRIIQADMQVINIQNLHQKPCFCIDIAGGQKVSEWVISVHGVSKQLLTSEFNERSTWEKFKLYSGRGIGAIIHVAVGLFASVACFPKQLSDFGIRLGPVVGYDKNGGNKIFKALDDPQVRQIIIEWIQQLLDSEAKVWKSMDEHRPMIIVEMKYLHSDWKNSATFASFVAILERLKILHDKGCVHGDIRLSNLLSSGHIVDFDFVELSYYTDGLQILNSGDRHTEVKSAIESGWIVI